MDVTTFYSYKGGLGRTLLLAWVAQSLAAQGKRVVAVDFDLEAPGLAFKLGFKLDADLGAGLVGLIRSFQRGAEAPETLLPWLRLVPGYSNLWLLPAGPGPTPQYWADLASISWQDLFFNHNPQGTRFFAWLRDHLDADATPAHVLVDARTGVTELGGAALALLADRIVALVGTSTEGLTGTREVLRALLHAPRPHGRPAPRVGVVLSRLPATLLASTAQSIRKTIRDFLNEEAEPLPATLELDLPLVVRSEPDLEVDERPALKGKNLRLHDDYRSFLEWFEGGPVLETMPGPGPSADGGVAALRASIELHRMSANRDPSRYMPEFARMFETLGAVLATEGKWEEAVEATREVVDIRRTLAQANPDAFLQYLAMSLNNLGARLRELGRREEALKATQESVDHYRALAQRNPDAFRPDLARSLNNLGAMLSSLGWREEALDATREALDLRRALAQHDPDAFRPDLAASLNNLGNRLRELGRREEALDATRKAVDLRRELAQRNPDAFRPDFAASLNNLGAGLSELGRQEEALDATREALDHYRELAQRNPDAFRPYLAGSLNNLGNRLSELGRREEALDATREAVNLRRELAQRNPDAFLPDLARSLNNLGSDLSSLGRREEALEATREAVDLRRKLALRNPDAFLPDLAGSLNNLGLRLSEAGRQKEALAVMAEALDTLWPFFTRIPAAFTDLAKKLLDQSQVLHASLGEPLPPTLVEQLATFRRLTQS